LLIGDSCIDEYKIGTVDRLSPEAPVPVVKIVDSYTLPGMASNVFSNLMALGIEPDFITNDAVIKKTRYIDKRSGQHLLRVDDESSIVPWSGRIHLSPIESYDAIVISDYNKGFLTYEHIENIIKSVTCPVFIDTKKQDLSRFNADNVYVKINELEYKTSISRPAQFIVTLGDQGALFTSPSIGAKMFETKRVEVMDVCGCGDTFLASLAYGYLSLGSIESAIIFANVAAGITVQHRGNHAPSYQEIKNAGY
jgi:D-beta-D-heptose 7-phosphate kinase/D-beta-D-heptose 1-phosphate adenosyltransferase